MQSTIPSPPDPETTGERYSRIASRYAGIRSATLGLDYLDRAMAACGGQGPALDVGCGAGLPLTRRLLDSGFEVTGIDLSEGMLALAVENVSEARLLLADARNFDEGLRYSLIVAWDSIFHLPLADQRPTMAHLFGLLAPGGVILFTAGGIDDERTGTMFGNDFYYSSLSRETYRRLMAEHGLSVVLEKDDQLPETHVVFVGRRSVKGG